ncbi:MAG: hypothetical protein AAFP02_15350 [Bacteroidota bacterium]
MRKFAFFFLFACLTFSAFGQRFYLAGERMIGLSNLGAGWVPIQEGVFQYNLSSSLRFGYFPLTSLAVGAEFNYQFIFATDNIAGTTERANSRGLNIFARWYLAPERSSFFAQTNFGGFHVYRQDGSRSASPLTYLDLIGGYALRPSEKFSFDLSLGIRRYFSRVIPLGARLELNFIPKIGLNYHF